LIRNPITFSGTPVKDYRAPPLLGADTKDVLASKLGYDEAKLAALKKQGIIQWTARLSPRPACGERSDCIADAIRVRGTLRERPSSEFAGAAPHPNPLPAKSGEKEK
jgi:hypothetical protein